MLKSSAPLLQCLTVLLATPALTRADGSHTFSISGTDSFKLQCFNDGSEAPVCTLTGTTTTVSLSGFTAAGNVYTGSAAGGTLELGVDGDVTLVCEPEGDCECELMDGSECECKLEDGSDCPDHDDHDHGDDEDACFSGANTVEIQGQGEALIGSLKIGDYVKAGNGEFSRVFSFSHLEHDAEMNFLQIQMEGLQRPLEVSPDHMLYTNTVVRASEVKVGDILGTNNKVLNIQSVKRRGVYAPVTESGDLMVSGALVSSYVAMLDYAPAYQHKAAQAAMALHRLVCYVNFGICEKETYNQMGLSDFTFPLLKILMEVRKQATFVQVGVTLLAVPFVAAFSTIEELILSPYLLALLGLGFFVYNKSKASKVKDM